jgi:hypothetical protein
VETRDRDQPTEQAAFSFETSNVGRIHCKALRLRDAYEIGNDWNKLSLAPAPKLARCILLLCGRNSDGGRLTEQEIEALSNQELQYFAKGMITAHPFLTSSPRSRTNITLTPDQGEDTIRFFERLVRLEIERGLIQRKRLSTIEEWAGRDAQAALARSTELADVVYGANSELTEKQEANTELPQQLSDLCGLVRAVHSATTGLLLRFGESAAAQEKCNFRTQIIAMIAIGVAIGALLLNVLYPFFRGDATKDLVRGQQRLQQSIDDAVQHLERSGSKASAEVVRELRSPAPPPMPPELPH